MAAPMDTGVELGFVEKTESYLLNSRYFPSKVGGKPAWLCLKHLPTVEDLSCGVCSKPTAFLMQVYSPLSNKHDCFHRTIFLFVCRNENCCKPNSADNIRIFRSQLPRQNDFYSATPPDDARVDSEVDAGLFNNVCVVCGIVGPKTCGKCHKVYYCSKDHQIIDWKSGHKRSCQQYESQSSTNHSWMFPEMELVTESETLIADTKEENKSSEEGLKEYKDYLQTHAGVADSQHLSDNELEKMASTETENDKQLRKFKKRISNEPEQVLRYQRGGEPLWIAHSPTPTDIPDCSCGGKRQFEFQVLPQLLSHLNVDKLETSLDWGTLCVYTCVESCSIGNKYRAEFIFKQDIV